MRQEWLPAAGAGGSGHPSPFGKTYNAEWRSRIERTSNERYTKPRACVEPEISRFLLGRVG
jgi:hypothetical protein